MTHRSDSTPRNPSSHVGSDISVDQVAKRLLNDNDHDNTYSGDDSNYDNDNEDNLKAF